MSLTLSAIYLIMKNTYMLLMGELKLQFLFLTENCFRFFFQKYLSFFWHNGRKFFLLNKQPQPRSSE